MARVVQLSTAQHYKCVATAWHAACLNFFDERRRLVLIREGDAQYGMIVSITYAVDSNGYKVPVPAVIKSFDMGTADLDKLIEHTGVVQERGSVICNKEYIMELKGDHFPRISKIGTGNYAYFSNNHDKPHIIDLYTTLY